MKKMTWMRGALALSVMLGASTALAADHLDSPAEKLVAAQDITDLFTWVDGSGNVILILNVNPSATTTTQFSNAVQYVFHTASAAGYPQTTPVETDIICTFTTAQKISCWVGTADYVTGDASSTTTPLASASGNVKVFAGLRDDPFFFNLGGFHDAEADVEAATGVTTDIAGCPNNLPAATVMALDKDIAGSNHGAAAAVDFFSPSTTEPYSGNVLSIVLSVKASLLTSGGPMMSVWASTNKGS